MLETVANFLVDFVHLTGYAGIFVLTFLESTFLPIPSEATMIPAGYLVHEGRLNFMLVWIISTLGTIGGSLFNYWIAHAMGKPFLRRYGKYMLLPPDKIAWLQQYFNNHGPISVFTGRLIPGIRHVISFPAGLAGMNLKIFTLYTAIGGSIWMLVLICVGYMIGNNKALVHEWMHSITAAVLVIVAIIIYVYVRKLRKRLL